VFCSVCFVWLCDGAGTGALAVDWFFLLGSEVHCEWLFFSLWSLCRAGFVLTGCFYFLFAFVE